MSLSHRDKLAIGLGVGGAASIVSAAWLLVVSVVFGSGSPPGAVASAPSASGLASAGASSAPPADVVVDVQGAVRRPGVALLPSGSRVADALAAAGGYSKKADLNAAAAALNLAAVLADGAQVYVPMIGATAAGPGTAGSSPGTGAGGLVNLNSASPEALDALPGIGPVTVQKIVAARAEQPFATLDEMVEREVIDRGQLEDIRDLVTF
jgi:competence protein ComEA